MDNKVHSLSLNGLLEYKLRSKIVNKRCVQHGNQNKIKVKCLRGLIGGKTNEGILAISCLCDEV